MPHDVKVEGTRYLVRLALDDHEWKVQLMMDRSVEDEIKLGVLSTNELDEAIRKLSSELAVPLNPFQTERLLEEMHSKTNHLLSERDYEEKQTIEPTEQRSSTTSSQHKQAEAAREAQESLVSEYRRKLGKGQSIDVRGSITEVKRTQDDPSQIQELIKSQKKMVETVKAMEERISYLEDITSKLIDLTDLLVLAQDPGIEPRSRQ